MQTQCKCVVNQYKHSANFKMRNLLLWDTISESLSKHGFSLKQVRLINGAYINGKNGVFLWLNKAITKDGKQQIPLKRKLRVSLL